MSARLNKYGKGLRTEIPASRFSREWFMQSLRTAVWVVVIVILVWVYADIHFTDEQEVTAVLHLHTKSDDGMLLLSKREIPVTFRIKGNRYYRDRFTNHLAKANSVLEFDVAGAKEYKPGEEYQERTANLLSKLPVFRDSGLEIISATPARIDIRMDKMYLVPDVLVRFKSIGAVLDGDPRIEPARINLRLPESMRHKINPSTITLVTRTVDLSGKAVGATETVNVDVLTPPNLNYAKIKPQKVTVTFKVGQQTDSKKFTVTVNYLPPNAWLTNDTWSKYKLEVKSKEDRKRTITVTGNRIDLQKLSDDQIHAYVVLTDSNLKPSAWLEGKVNVKFPPGLKIRLAEAIPPVSYRVVKRTSVPVTP